MISVAIITALGVLIFLIVAGAVVRSR